MSVGDKVIVLGFPRCEFECLSHREASDVDVILELGKPWLETRSMLF